MTALSILPRTELVKALLLDQVSGLVGQDIHVRQMELAILPHPSLQVFDLEVNNIDPSIELLKARVLDVEIDLLPLLFRTLVLKRLVLEEPFVIVRLLDEQTVSSAVPLQEPSPTTASLPPPSIEHVAILGGSLTLRKASTSQTAKDLVIEDIQISLDTPASSLPINVQVAAKAFNNDNEALVFGFSGVIDQLSSNNVARGNLWGNLPPLELSGRVEVSNFDMAEFQEFYALGTGRAERQALVSLGTQINLFPDISGVSLVFSDLQGSIGSTPIRGKGSLSGLMGNDITFFSSLSSSPIPLRTLLSLIPSTFIPMDVRRTIQEHDIEGTIELANSTIAGSTADDIGTSVLEEVRVSEGRLSIRSSLPPISNIGGTVFWDNGHLRIVNLTGEYQSTKVMNGQADVQFRESGPWSHVHLNTHVDVQDLLTIWAELAYPQEPPSMLSDVQGGGNVFVKARGPLQNPQNMVIETIQLQDGTFSASEDFPPIDHVSGSMNLTNDRLTVDGLKAEFRSSKIIDAQAVIQFREQGPWGQVQAKTFLKVRDIRSLITQLEPSFEMPDVLSSLKGEGNLSFSLEGPLHEPQRVVIEKARLGKGRFHIHPDLPALEPVSATVSLHDSTLQIADVTVAFRSSAIRSATGTIKFGGTEPWVNMPIHADLEAQDVVELIDHLDPIPEVLQPVAELTDVSGGSQLTFTIQGPLNNPEQLTVSSGAIRLEDIRFHMPHISETVERVAGRAIISDGELRISSLSGQIGKSHARLRGTIGIDETHKFEDVRFRAHLETIDMNKLRPGSFPDAFQGHMQLTAMVSGQQDSPDFKVHADLKDMAFDIPNVIDKPDSMPASLQAEGRLQDQKIIIVDHAELDLPQLQLSGKGTFNTGAPLTIAATVGTAPVSLASLPEKMLFGIKKFKSGDLSLALDVNGTGNDWREWKLIGSATIHDMVEENDASGDQVGNLSIDVKVDQEAGELNFNLEAIPIRNLISLAGTTGAKFTGDLWMKGTLQSRLAPNQDPIPSLNGHVSLSVKNGTVRPGEVLSRILTYINLPSVLKGDVTFDQNTLPFTSFTGDVDIKNGVLHSDNLVFQSPVLMLSTIGDHDLTADRLDVVVAASPLVSYTKLLENVPLVNKLLGKGNRQFLTVFFEVKGPPKNPEVSPMPFKSVEAQARGLIDLSVETLKNAVNLPKEALTSSPEKQKASSTNVD